MNNHKTRNILLIAGAVITAILAVVVIVVSTRIQQTGSTPVAPNVPQSQPQAAVPEACSTTFTPTFPKLPQPSCASKTAFKNVASNKVDADKIGTYDLSAANAIAANAVVHPGDIIVYHLTGVVFDNNQIGSVFWTDTLGAKLTFMDTSLGGDCTATVNADTTTKVVCKVADIKPGHPEPNAKYEVSIRAKVKAAAAAGVMNNQATVGIDTTAANQSAMCSIALTIPGIAVSPSPSPSVSPSPSPSVTPSPSPSPTPTGTPGTGFYIVKYNDVNGNGSQDSGEAGLAWSFQWEVNGDGNWRDYVTADTNGQGGNVGDRTGGEKITIREIGKDGWSSTTPSSLDITMTQGVIQKVMFGNRQKTAAGCNNSCVTDSDCASGLSCSASMCRNISCSDKTNCVCDITTTPTPKLIAQVTPTPTSAPLPKSGSTSETVGTIAVGVVISVLGVIGLFAL